MIEASHVEVSVTFRDAVMTTTLTKNTLAYRDRDEMQAALLYDIIGLARADLRVPEEDVWTFGQGEEPDESAE